jgi:YebC/PmpR family DNA-binding regulatory protein
MSGHSKWSTIKRQKGAADAKRSMAFTKLAAMITVAARDGGGDPSANFKLRLAMDKARQANMPKDNVDRAIKRGTGELGGAAFEHVVYEAYAPGGAALMIDVNTDNRNRAVSSIKGILTKYSGKLAEAGSVAYLFQQKGVMTAKGADAESAELQIIESGAADYVAGDDGTFTVYTDPKETTYVAKALEDAGLTVTDVDLSMEPTASVMISDPKTANTLITLTELLEDLDDVTAVYPNFDIDPSLNLA